MDVRDNPRGGSLDRLLPFLILGGGYYAARQGLFGNDIARQLLVFEARLGGGATGALNPSVPAGGSVASPATPSAALGGCHPTQDANNYVGAWQDGYTVVVHGSRVVDPRTGSQVFRDLPYAQDYFNRAYCGA